MAVKKGNYISGSIADVVFRENKGQQIIQSAPVKNIKRTIASKKSADIFGKSSSLSEIIRHLFEYVIIGFHDTSMVNRLIKSLQTILSHYCDAQTGTYDFNQNSFSRLNGFDFNLSSPLNESLWLSPESTLEKNTITITVPEMKIPKEFRFPEDTSSCIIDVMVNFYHLEKGIMMHLNPEIRRIEVLKTQAVLARQDLVFDAPAGCLCIAVIGLRYFAVRYNHTLPYNSKVFHPAGICAAYITPGTFDIKNIKKWYERGPVFTAASGRSSTTDQASLR